MTHAKAQVGSGEPEWFARPDSPERGEGLRFACTSCGNCCTGVPGYVLVSDAEVAALAQRLNLSTDAFIQRYTQMLPEGRSLIETHTRFGYDCVFLDRAKVPGKAVCGVYEDRPIQCRTWPFWPNLLRSRNAWNQAAKGCPGMNTGPLIPLQQIRIQRDAINI
ncbi:MAG: YkgJ family cysteine cluster protein [Phycisphaerae bacterium]|nr:YkgJ family cysteine cluster protein [Phycisphaerae bacterium]